MNRQINSTSPEMPVYEEYISEIRDIFDTGILTNNGPKLRKLQSLLKERTGCKNLELFVNGHTALYLGIQAMNFPKDSEVITSPFTFLSTANAIVQNGLTPVFCDIDESYNLSIENIERNITGKTCAIVTPHIFGIPCHVKEIEEIAKKFGLKVIYDGAQAFGTRIGGVDIAKFGDATMFSLHAIKVFNSIEGGVLCFKDDCFLRQLIESRNFGICIEDKEDSDYIGMNAKMDEFRAAMGIVNLAKVDETIKKRKRLVEYYIQHLDEIKGIESYGYQDGISYNYAYFPIKVKANEYGRTRDELYEILLEAGIMTRKLYSRLVCDYKAYKGKGYRTDVGYAKEVIKESLDLPIYSKLEFEDIDVIVDAMRQAQKFQM